MRLQALCRRCPKTPELALLVGFTSYVVAADCMLHVSLILAQLLAGCAYDMDVVCSIPPTACSFMASALDLMARPWPRVLTSGLNSEASVWNTMKGIMSDKSIKLTPELEAAWLRLQRSGVLRERDMETAATRARSTTTERHTSGTQLLPRRTQSVG